MEKDWAETWNEEDVLEGHLSRQLAWWLRHISPRKDAGRFHRLLVLVRGTKAAIVSDALWLTVGITIIVLADTMRSAQPGILYAWCALCSLPLVCLLALRMPQMQLCLRAMIAAAENVERYADDESKARLERYARFDRRRALAYLIVFSPTPLLVQFDLEVIDWVRDYPWRRWVVGLTICVGFTTALMSFYLVLPLAITLGTSASEMHRIIARALESGAATPRWAALQSQVLRASLHMNVVVPIVLPCVVLGSVIMPVFGMAELVINYRNIDWLSVIGTPTILCNFIPVCEVGDKLRRARAGVLASAYNGPWLEETQDQRILRLAIMRASTGHGAMMRGRAVGNMNRGTCLRVLKTWFSYVQTMLQIRT